MIIAILKRKRSEPTYPLFINMDLHRIVFISKKMQKYQLVPLGNLDMLQLAINIFPVFPRKYLSAYHLPVHTKLGLS